MTTPTYNRVMRKLIVGFGDLFSNITMLRYNADESEQERMVVPIAYAAKEKYVQRLEGDPDLDKKVQMTLPRMSYEMNGLQYAANRKQITNIKNFYQTPLGVSSQYNPVPYDFEFSLYIYVRNIEDGTQIIEHVLPFFAPDYTIKLDLIAEMGITKDIPIILKTVTHEIQYEGDRESDPRMVIWTLNFTVQGFVFGAISNSGLIRTSFTNILTEYNGSKLIQLNLDPSGNGYYKNDEVVYQGYSVGTATASAIVKSWANNKLYVTEVMGHFSNDRYLVGLNSGAKYRFTSYQVVPQPDVTIKVVPNPLTANANDAYTYTTTITEN